MSYTLKIKKHISKRRKQSLFRAFSFIQGYHAILCCLLLAFFGCATVQSSYTESMKKPPLQEAGAEITAIDIQDSMVTVMVNKPFTYTIYKPGDPYKMVVDIPEVRVGNFLQRIVSSKAGITEIIPSQIETPSLMARLEMILQTPSSVEQEYKNNTLIIKIKGDIGGQEAPYKRTAMSTASPTSKATEISDISFDGSGDSLKVMIRGNGSMTPSVIPLDDQIMIDIPDVAMNATIPSRLPLPLKDIRSEKKDDRIRIALRFKEKTTFDVTSIGDTVVVTLKGSDYYSSLAAKMLKGSLEEETELGVGETPRTADMTRPIAQGTCESYLAGRENVNFDFQDQDIVPILRLFADISGCNLFIHPEVKGKATMKFRDVPWDQALDTLLKTFSLGKTIEGNIIRVAPHKVFASESKEKAEAAEALLNAEPLDTKVFPISYAEVSVVEASIRSSGILSKRGSISVDKRTSTMLVKDVQTVFPQIESLLATLDRPTPQVLIEARIVELNTNHEQSLGIQWGLNVQSTDRLMSAGGLSGVPNTSTGPFTGQNYLVDFPTTAVGPLSGSGFTFGIINPAKTIGLDLQLSAIENIGELKVISKPKILTVDNGKAKISQGKSIPIRKLTSEGTISTEFKDVTLDLNVTPHITPDGSIQMMIDIKKEELDPTVPSIEGVPGTDKKEANTNVIIKDGETIVIGGMYKINTDTSEAGVPGLMKIPIIGHLFRNKSERATTTELLIFITPRIVEKP